MKLVFTYKGVDHVAMVTKRLAAMKTFYVESLGLTLEQESKAKAGYSVVTLRAAYMSICHRIKHLRCYRHVQAQRDGPVAGGSE